MTRFRSLRTKTVTALITVALVPASILAVVWYRTSVTALLRGANTGLVAAASRAAASLDGYLNAGLDGIRTNAQLPTFRDYLASPTPSERSLALTVLQTLSHSDSVNIRAIRLLSTDGRVLISSDGNDSTTARVSDPLVLSAVAAVAPVLTPVHLRSDDPFDASFLMAAPIRGTSGTLGILEVEYEAAVLQQVLGAQTRLLGERAQSILYDENNVRLAGTLDPRALFRTTNPLPDTLRARLLAERRLRTSTNLPAGLTTTRRVRNLRVNPDSTFVYDLFQQIGDGTAEAFLGAAASLRNNRWRVSIEIPRLVGIGDTSLRLVRDTVLLALLLTVLVSAAAVLIARRLTRPLQELTDTSRRFAAGELDVRVRVDTQDEFGRLGIAFNELADRLGNLVTGLAQRTQQLEDDIKTRERLESELVQTRKLEAVGKLAGGIAHDFNNLLTVVAQSAEFARDEPGVSNVVSEALEDITDAAARGAALTRQLLTFAKRSATTPRLIDAGDAVRSTERLLRQVLGSHIRLEVEVPDAPHCMLVDPTQLEQVLVNLAANARDAMPVNGTLRIAVSGERASEQLGGIDAVVLEVADTGVGMTEAVAARAFEPFYSTKESTRGTGLGLATVYGIVTQAGGTVGVSSVPGEGTTFLLRWPRRDGVPIAPPADVPSLPREGGRETVLLVEDEPGVRHAVARTLRRLGYTVHEASDGTEGIALGRLHGERIDLLLTDVVMPGANGFLVASTLVPEIPGLHVLLMSGYSSDARAQFRAEAPSFPLIEKPFSLDALAAAVAQVLATGTLRIA